MNSCGVAIWMHPSTSGSMLIRAPYESSFLPMPERQVFAAEFKRTTASPFSVFTDIDNGYALSLNLAVWVGPDLKNLLSSFGRLLPEYQGNDAWILPIPATFVVGRDGRISARFVDPDFRRRMSVEELIAALRAGACASSHGQNNS